MPVTAVANLDDQRLIREGEAAVERYNENIKNVRADIMPMARGLVAAKRKYPANQEFGAWLKTSPYNEVEKDDRAALIKLGRYEHLAEKFVRNICLVSPRTIWDALEDFLPSSHDAKTTSEPTLIPEPSIPVPVLVQTTESPGIIPTKVSDNPPATPEPETYEPPKSSKLYDLLKKDTADVLFTRFKHASMFIKLAGKDRASTMLGHLAERCVRPDYPVELLLLKTWTSRMLYPHLPQGFLDRQSSKLSVLAKQHTALAETERLFKLAPEFGVTHPPMLAINAAHDILARVEHAKNGNKPDPAATHKRTFAADEGKPPVVIRGTQLWPAESDASYSYDDLRCACGLANDVLLTFGEPRDAPMATKSLKLRHVLAWLPGGYNAYGTTIDGAMKALTLVVQAYSANKNDTMRLPTITLARSDS